MKNDEIRTLLDTTLSKNAKVLYPLLGGMMNEAYVVEDDNKKFVLYISTKQANEMVDREKEKTCHEICYKLGITNKNIYFDTNNGIKINEYIEGNSLDKITSFDYQKIADLFKKLHNSNQVAPLDYQPFDRFINYENEALTYQNQREQDYTNLRDILFNNRRFLENQPLKICHNDAQKSNIVKSLTDQYYFIDFEFMANNDPLYDIAAFGNGLVKEGYKLLLTYCDNNPTKEEINRFALWRIFLSLQWYNVAITKHYRGEGITHKIDFLKVANFFLNNAKDALGYLND